MSQCTSSSAVLGSSSAAGWPLLFNGSESHKSVQGQPVTMDTNRWRGRTIAGSRSISSLFRRSVLWRAWPTNQAPVSAERGSLVIVFIIIMLTGMMMMLSAGAPDPDSQGRRHAKGLWIKWDVGCWWWGIKSHVLGGWAIKQSRSLLKNARPLKMDYLIVRDGLRAIILLSRACPVSDD